MTGFLLNLARRSAGVAPENAGAAVAPRSWSEVPASLPDTMTGAALSPSDPARAEAVDPDHFDAPPAAREGEGMNTPEDSPSRPVPAAATSRPLPAREEEASYPDAADLRAPAPAVSERPASATPPSIREPDPVIAPSPPGGHDPDTPAAEYTPAPRPRNLARDMHRGLAEPPAEPHTTAEGPPRDPAPPDASGGGADLPPASARAAVPPSDPNAHGTPIPPVTPPAVTSGRTSVARALDAPSGAAPATDAGPNSPSRASASSAPLPADVPSLTPPAPAGPLVTPSVTRPRRDALESAAGHAPSPAGDRPPVGQVPEAGTPFPMPPIQPISPAPSETRSAPTPPTDTADEPAPPPPTPSAPLLRPPLPNDHRDDRRRHAEEDPALATRPVATPLIERSDPQRPPGRPDTGAETIRTAEPPTPHDPMRAQPDPRPSSVDLPAGRRVESGRTVQVRIGTVEVRGATAPVPPPQAQRARPPRGFDAYRRVRTHEG